MLHHTEFDFLWLFIHLRLRKKCLQIPCIFLSFKGNLIWTCAVGPVISISVVGYFICQKSSHRFLLFFSLLLRILSSLKLWNKKWGSPCPSKRKGAFISLSSLVWGKSLTFCTRTRSRRALITRLHWLQLLLPLLWTALKLKIDKRPNVPVNVFVPIIFCW